MTAPALTGGPAVVAIVGAGPRGVGVLERLAANAPELFGDRPLEVHLIDPFPPGPGRVWRYEQSPLLRMNSMAEDVTMFTDDSVRCAGPIRPGPSMFEWAARTSRLVHDGLDAELGTLTGFSFPTRRLQSEYLAWVYDHVVAGLPPGISVRLHTAQAVDVTGPPDGPQRVWLADRPEPLVADVVVLAVGHLDAEPAAEHSRLAGFAAERGLYYLPPEYTADVDLSGIMPGQVVVLRGFGLAFVDLMVLLTEGRGGRYVSSPDGTCRYMPSGREPRLYVGSRRGVPYHAKPAYRLVGERPPLPRFFGPDAVDALLAGRDQVDFRRDVWPLMAKEVGWGYYHELFTGHPDRVALGWAEFAARYAELDWYGAELRALVDRAVPAAEDRLDFEALDRPLAGLAFETAEELQAYLRAYMEADVARRSDPAYSADLGAFYALLSVFGNLPRVVASGKLTPRSRVRDLEGWWRGLFNYYASGPPGDRLEQLLALSRAGVVRFLGADMWVEPDATGGVFRAGSASTPDVVEATGLVEAVLPGPTVLRTRDVLFGALREAGAGVEEVLDDGAGFRHQTGLLRVVVEDGRIVDAAGEPHPRRYALGPYTTARSTAAFARPKTNAAGFRQNDATARAILTFLREPAARPGPLVVAET